MKQFITVTTPDQAAEIIIFSQTRPPQIDYVSPGEKMKLRAAEEFIENLPAAEKKKWEKHIGSYIDAYYSPTIKGTDGKMYSVAALDAMF